MMPKNQNGLVSQVFLITSIASLSILGVGCFELEETSSNYPEPSPPDTVAETPPTSEPSWDNCPYDVEPISTGLQNSYNRVLNHGSGNVHLLAELQFFIIQAETVIEDPRCETVVRASGLNQYLEMGNTALNVGENRLQKTYDLIEDLSN